MVSCCAAAHERVREKSPRILGLQIGAMESIVLGLRKSRSSPKACKASPRRNSSNRWRHTKDRDGRGAKRYRPGIIDYGTTREGGQPDRVRSDHPEAAAELAHGVR